MNRWWIVGVVLAFVLAMGVWVTPHALGFYHQEQGGRLLERALAVEGQGRDDPLLLLKPLENGDARRLAEQAAVHFRAAVRAGGANAQAYRWLGRTALLLGEPEEAVGAFSEFVRQRPDNPLGYWELGLAYERLAREAEKAVRVEFAPELDEGMDLAIINAARALTLPLSTATIETPDVPIDTSYCDQGEMPGSCFVALTEWEMLD
ncbi:MAG TPA: tetratricopeptide repeat protein [Thermoflexia bacterium]|jgi:tetratricopeptide (TPR) repeat protein|nr:tetratricopeptide repeat protein [Thermoflexia bacterium]